MKKEEVVEIIEPKKEEEGVQVEAKKEEVTLKELSLTGNGKRFVFPFCFDSLQKHSKSFIIGGWYIVTPLIGEIKHRKFEVGFDNKKYLKFIRNDKITNHKEITNLFEVVWIVDIKKDNTIKTLLDKIKSDTGKEDFQYRIANVYNIEQEKKTYREMQYSFVLNALSPATSDLWATYGLHYKIKGSDYTEKIMREKIIEKVKNFLGTLYKKEDFYNNNTPKFEDFNSLLKLIQTIAPEKQPLFKDFVRDISPFIGRGTSEESNNQVRLLALLEPFTAINQIGGSTLVTLKTNEKGEERLKSEKDYKFDPLYVPSSASIAKTNIKNEFASIIQNYHLICTEIKNTICVAIDLKYKEGGKKVFSQRSSGTQISTSESIRDKLRLKYSRKNNPFDQGYGNVFYKVWQDNEDMGLKASFFYELFCNNPIIEQQKRVLFQHLKSSKTKDTLNQYYQDIKNEELFWTHYAQMITDVHNRLRDGIGSLIDEQDFDDVISSFKTELIDPMRRKIALFYTTMESIYEIISSLDYERYEEEKKKLNIEKAKEILVILIKALCPFAKVDCNNIFIKSKDIPNKDLIKLLKEKNYKQLNNNNAIGIEVSDENVVNKIHQIFAKVVEEEASKDFAIGITNILKACINVGSVQSFFMNIDTSNPTSRETSFIKKLYEIIDTIKDDETNRKLLNYVKQESFKSKVRIKFTKEIENIYISTEVNTNINKFYKIENATRLKNLYFRKGMEITMDAFYNSNGSKFDNKDIENSKHLNELLALVKGSDNADISISTEDVNKFEDMFNKLVELYNSIDEQIDNKTAFPQLKYENEMKIIMTYFGAKWSFIYKLHDEPNLLNSELLKLWKIISKGHYYIKKEKVPNFETNIGFIEEKISQIIKMFEKTNSLFFINFTDENDIAKTYVNKSDELLKIMNRIEDGRKIYQDKVKEFAHKLSLLKVKEINSTLIQNYLNSSLGDTDRIVNFIIMFELSKLIDSDVSIYLNSAKYCNSEGKAFNETLFEHYFGTEHSAVHWNMFLKKHLYNSILLTRKQFENIDYVDPSQKTKVLNHLDEIAFRFIGSDTNLGKRFNPFIEGANAKVFELGHTQIETILKEIIMFAYDFMFITAKKNKIQEQYKKEIASITDSVKKFIMDNFKDERQSGTNSSMILHQQFNSSFKFPINQIISGEKLFDRSKLKVITENKELTSADITDLLKNHFNKNKYDDIKKKALRKKFKEIQLKLKRLDFLNKVVLDDKKDDKEWLKALIDKAVELAQTKYKEKHTEEEIKKSAKKREEVEKKRVEVEKKRVEVEKKKQSEVKKEGEIEETQEDIEAYLKDDDDEEEEEEETPEAYTARMLKEEEEAEKKKKLVKD